MALSVIFDIVSRRDNFSAQVRMRIRAFADTEKSGARATLSQNAQYLWCNQRVGAVVNGDGNIAACGCLCW